MRITLSQRELGVLDQALRIAREQFHKNAADVRKSPGNNERLVAQFMAQAIDCSDMLGKLEDVADADGLPVGPCGHFQSDGRDCCRNCGHFHGRTEG